MSWVISVDELVIESTEDGLSSWMTPTIESWLRSQEYMVNVDPYPSAVAYDPDNESVVLAAHLDYFQSSGMGGPELIIRHSDTGPYVQDTDESDEIKLELE